MMGDFQGIRTASQVLEQVFMFLKCLNAARRLNPELIVYRRLKSPTRSPTSYRLVMSNPRGCDNYPDTVSRHNL